MSTLNQLIQQKISRRPPGARAALRLGGNRFQLCSPLKKWDWDNELSGTISTNQFEFCDQNIKSFREDTFMSSNDSLSKSYRSFLLQLNEQFALQESLKQALAMTAPIPPDFSPNRESAPDGWVKVSDGGNQLRWRPAYNVGETPRSWKTGILAKERSPLKIPIEHLPISIFSLQSEHTPDTQLANDSDKEVHIFADAWDRIEIRPGDWYDSSIFDHAALQPTAFNHGLTMKDFVGIGKSLSAMVVEILVVMNPVLVIESDFDILPELDMPSAITAVELDNFSIQNPSIVRVSNDNNREELRFAAEEDTPYILGVFLKPIFKFSRNSNKKAFVFNQQQKLSTAKDKPTKVKLSCLSDGKTSIQGEGNYHIQINKL